MSDIFCEIKHLAEIAGQMILKTSPFITKYKGTKENYSTKTDLEIQSFLKSNLTKILPESMFMGEENDFFELSECRYLWVVDPIDGTVNFSRHIPMSVVSIALVENKQTCMGVVYNPYLDEMYSV